MNTASQAMKKATIFVAAPPSVFEAGVWKCWAFFRRLNDCYSDNGLYFTLIPSEDMEGPVIESEFSGSDFAFFLLKAEIGEDMINLYKTGVDAFHRNGKPGIAAYIRTGTSQLEGEPGRLTDQLNLERGAIYQHL